ncbi:MAG: hypothetical protein WCP69_13580 [Bacteroidota bacterium]
MDTIRQKQIIINSTILFVIASIVAMTLHEVGHFFASIIVHARGISIHHNYTANDNDGLSLQNLLFIKGAGPFISIAIALLFHFICSRQAKRNNLFLFNLYMAAFGYIGFFGYVMIAPLFTGGDTGYICYALGFPIWLTIIVAFAGGVGLYLIISSLTKYFLEMGSKEIIENKEARIQFIHSLLLYPIFIGIIITTLMNLPTRAFLSLIAPLCSPFSLFWAYGNALKKNYLSDKFNKEFESFNKPNFWLFFWFVITIIVNRLLVIGIYVN